MSRKIEIEVSELTYALMSRQARDIGRGTKPEQVAEDWVEHQARTTRDLHQRFKDADKIVDQRMRSGEISG